MKRSFLKLKNFKLITLDDFDQLEEKFEKKISSVLANLESQSFNILQAGESSIDLMVISYIHDIWAALVFSDTSISIRPLSSNDSEEYI